MRMIWRFLSNFLWIYNNLLYINQTIESSKELSGDPPVDHNSQFEKCNPLFYWQLEENSVADFCPWAWLCQSVDTCNALDGRVIITFAHNLKYVVTTLKRNKKHYALCTGGTPTQHIYSVWSQNMVYNSRGNGRACVV